MENTPFLKEPANKIGTAGGEGLNIKSGQQTKRVRMVIDLHKKQLLLSINTKNCQQPL